VFGGQRASSNHASLPCSEQSENLNAESTDSSAIPVDSEFCVCFCRIFRINPNESLPAKRRNNQVFKLTTNVYKFLHYVQISYLVIPPRRPSSARPREGLSIKSLPAQFLQRGRAEAEKQYLTTCITAISSTSTTII
jgi:hypothetical protein